MWKRPILSHPVTTTTKYPIQALNNIVPSTQERCQTTIVQSSMISIKPNYKLEQIKNEGIRDLERITEECIKRSRQSLFASKNISSSSSSSSANKKQNENHLDSHGEMPSIKQLKKSKQLYDILNDELERISNQHLLFCILGESIEITRVECTPDLRHARVYWTLPEVLMDTPEAIVRAATSKMQDILTNKGGARMIRSGLAQKLKRARFVPTLKFIPDNTLLSHTDVVVRNLRDRFS